MTRYHVRVGDVPAHGTEEFDVGIEEAAGGLLVSVGGATHRVDLAEVMPGCYSLIVDGRSHDLEVVAAAGVGGRRWALVLDGETCAAEVGGRSQPTGVPGGAAAGIGEVRAPMPGLLVAVRVAEGAEVALGQPLIIMEAMKMQMEIRAPRAGTVRQVHAAPGQEIAGGQLLTTIE